MRVLEERRTGRMPDVPAAAAATAAAATAAASAAATAAAATAATFPRARHSTRRG